MTRNFRPVRRIAAAAAAMAFVPRGGVNEPWTAGRRASWLRPSCPAAALALSLAWLTGCGGYPEVSPDTYELAKALYTVCNRKDAQQLKSFQQLVDQTHESSKISEEEKELLDWIAELAEQGDWAKAQQQTRQLLEDQNRPA